MGWVNNISIWIVHQIVALGLPSPLFEQLHSLDFFFFGGWVGGITPLKPQWGK